MHIPARRSPCRPQFSKTKTLAEPQPLLFFASTAMAHAGLTHQFVTGGVQFLPFKKVHPQSSPIVTHIEFNYSYYMS